MDINAAAKDQQTALMWACLLSGLEVCRTLIDCEADIHATDDFGRSAIFYSVENNRLSIVKLLAEKGADFAHRKKLGTQW